MGCVGSKFFDGVVNTAFCKRLKRRLQETVSASTNNPRCLGLFRAYVLWLEEPLLQEASLYLPSLPPQYEPERLALILQAGDVPAWLEFCDTTVVTAQRSAAATDWRTGCCRESLRVRTPESSLSDDENPIKRIKSRLDGYDRPLPPPKLPSNNCTIPTLRISDKNSLAKDFCAYLKRLKQFADLYSLQCSEHAALDTQFKDLVPHLYKMVSTGRTLTKTCGPACSRQAVITLNFTEARMNDAVRQQMQTNRYNLQSLLNRSLQPVEDNVVMMCAGIERTADELCVTKGTGLGPDMFFLLVDVYSDELAK